MSQMQPEARPLPPPPPRGGAAAPRPAGPAAGGGNVFTRHIGPLPMWVWVLIAAALIIGLSAWRSRGKAATTGPATSAGAYPATSGAGQVPQFVNQTYVSPVPPTVPQPVSPPKCPKGQAWDPDENKCVPESKVKAKGKAVNPGGPIRNPKHPASRPARAVARQVRRG